MTKVLKLEGINKVFNRGTVDEKAALVDINLHLAPGDFVTVIGSNGAGKSTLMNIISGTIFPDEGTIELDGKRVEQLPEHHRFF